MSLTQLELGVYDAVANFNIGKKASVLIYEKMNLLPGKFTLQGCDKISRKKLFASKYKEIDSTQKRRKIRRGKAKQEDENAFSQNAIFWHTGKSTSRMPYPINLKFSDIPFRMKQHYTMSGKYMSSIDPK